MLQSWKHAARLAGPSSRSAGLHTSTPLAKAAATSLTAKRTHEAERAERRRERAANAPHVVLGTRPGEEYKWAECDLARCIMTEAQIRAATKIVPGYGVSPGSAEERLLFTALPTLSAEMSTEKMRQNQRPGLHLESEADKADASSALVQELGVEGAKVEHLRKLLDLRNANAASIAYENRRRCVQEFSAPDKPDDTGRVEVQAAIATMRIRGLWDHLLTNKKDVANRMNLRKLVHHRAKLLKYLKRTSRGRYDALLPRLALEPEAVEGELIV